jgi:hypothetical protein
VIRTLRRGWWLLAPAMVLIAYRTVSRNGFLGDANFLIAENRYIQDLANLWDNLATTISTSSDTSVLAADHQGQLGPEYQPTRLPAGMRWCSRMVISCWGAVRAQPAWRDAGCPPGSRRAPRRASAPDGALDVVARARRQAW